MTRLTNIAERLAEVMVAYPTLTDFGVGIIMGTPAAERDAEFAKERAALVAAVEDVAWTVDWLRQHIEPTKTINQRRSSYGLKHVAERFSPKHYITNGVFIAAALIAGYRAKFLWNNPNVLFAMSERSIKAVELPHSY